MKAREIKGLVFRVKLVYGGNILVEIPEDDVDAELAKFCADLSVKGYSISSVSRVFPDSNATPRVSVLSTKEYKDEVKRLLNEKKKGENK